MRIKLPNSDQSKPIKYVRNKPNGGYTEGQLNERVRGPVIAREFEFPNDILQNYRECSLTSASLHGPDCFVDGDINLYQRRDFLKWYEARSWKAGKIIEKPSDASDSSGKKPKLNIVRQ